LDLKSGQPSALYKTKSLGVAVNHTQMADIPLAVKSKVTADKGTLMDRVFSQIVNETDP
jgi:hypothetical protein